MLWLAKPSPSPRPGPVRPGTEQDSYRAINPNCIGGGGRQVEPRDEQFSEIILHCFNKQVSLIVSDSGKPQKSYLFSGPDTKALPPPPRA